jgi:hypothetical protein
VFVYGMGGLFLESLRGSRAVDCWMVMDGWWAALRRVGGWMHGVCSRTD